MFRRRAHASGALLFIQLLLIVPTYTACTSEQGDAVAPPTVASVERAIELSREHLENGSLAEADSLGRIAVDLSRDIPDDPLLQARAIDVWVDALIQTRNATDPEPLELGRRAVALKESLEDPPPGELAASLVNLSILQRQRDDLEAVEPLLLRALELRALETPPDSVAIAEVHNELATLYTDTDHFDLAVRHFEIDLRICENLLGPNDPSLARKYNHYGRMLYQDARYQAALDAQYHALEILESKFGNRYYANAYVLNQIGTAEEEMGRFPVAQGCYRRALSIALDELGEEHMLTSSLRMNQGRLKLSMGDYATALEIYEASLPATRASWGPKHRYVAVVLGGIAETYRAMHEYTLAEELELRCIEAFEAALEADHSDVAGRWYHLAKIYYDMDRYQEALVWHRRALDHRLEVNGEKSLYAAWSRHQIGRTLQAMGRCDEAAVELEIASRVFLKELSALHPTYAQSIADLAVSLHALGRVDESLTLALDAQAILSEHSAYVFQTLPEREALAFASRDVAPTRDLLATLALENEEPDLIWEALMRSRAGVLDAMARRQRTLHWIEEPEYQALAREYTIAAERYARLLVGGPVAEAERWAEIQKLAMEERDEAERKLAKATGELLKDDDGGMHEVRDALPPRTALVGWFSFTPLAGDCETLDPGNERSPEYMAFVLPSAEAGVQVVGLGSAESIDRDVHEWMDEARRGAAAASSDLGAEAQYRQVAVALRESAWDPLTLAIGENRRVLITPEGELHRLHFAALPVGENAYLADSGWTFHGLSRELDLTAAAESSSSTGVLLAFGDPDFDREPGSNAEGQNAFRGATADCPQFRSMRFHQLPASGLEVDEVTKLWEQFREGGQARELRGAEATEAQLKKSARGCEVLHLATHGFVIAEDCAAVPGTRGFSSSTYLEQAAITPANSLLQLSGLAFASANRRAEAGPGQEDGILTSQEIAALDLAGVRWAVLSACDTGGGEIQSGEGVFGLRRSFEIAGAQSLVMSLWPVRDQIAREWMVELYRERLENEASTIEAVNAASATLLARRRAEGGSTHPALWGAFVACGNWR